MTNPKLVFGINSDQDPHTDPTHQNSSNGLSGFIFNFFVSPLTRLSNRLASSEPSPPAPTSSPTPSDNESSPTPPLENSHSIPELSPNHVLSQFFANKGDAPLTQAEARRVMALLNDSNTPEQTIAADERHQPTQPAKPLPTVFMPTFPSLARPPVPSPSRPSAPLRARARPPTAQRRTFYMGPGHSIMNSSTRLTLARRRRIGTLHTSASLPNGYDFHPPTHSFEPEPKRRRLSDPQSEPAQPSPQPEAAQTEAGTSRRPEHQNLCLPRTIAATPARPSPLRHVTLPASTPSPSPPKRAPPRSVLHATPGPRKAKKRTSSILSSVMKEVDAEMRSRTPVPSPIKPAEVINPYSALERPRRGDLLFGARPPSSGVPPPAKPAEEREARKRRIEVCLDGETAGTGTELERADPPQKKNRTEQVLEQTMPNEYRQEGRDKKRTKTRQIGKLPDRLIKKQEQMKKRLAATTGGGDKGKAVAGAEQEPPSGSQQAVEQNEGSLGLDNGPFDSPPVTVNFATGFKLGGTDPSRIPLNPKSAAAGQVTEGEATSKPSAPQAPKNIPVDIAPQKAPLPVARPASLAQQSARMTADSLVVAANGTGPLESPSGQDEGKSSAPSPPDAEDRELRETEEREVDAASGTVDSALSLPSGQAEAEEEEEAAKKAALAMDPVGIRGRFVDVLEGLFELADAQSGSADGDVEDGDAEVKQVVVGFNSSELPRFTVLL